ncbi:MAG: TnpV protein [Oscillospiraceae bacterium]|nr:TnpV protein [Oscillospiraceae bacterium]
MNPQETITEKLPDGTEITYTPDTKTGTYLLELTPPEHPEIGFYGKARAKYLREQKPTKYEIMLIKGTLNQHLTDTDRMANKQEELLIKKMAESAGVNEKLKSTDQMKWVRMMNNIRHRAREITLNELIYN